MNSRFCGKTQWQMFLLVSDRHAGWAPAWRPHTNLYNLGNKFIRISCIRKIAVNWNGPFSRGKTFPAWACSQAILLLSCYPTLQSCCFEVSCILRPIREWLKGGQENFCRYCANVSCMHFLSIQWYWEELQNADLLTILVTRISQRNVACFCKKSYLSRVSLFTYDDDLSVVTFRFKACYKEVVKFCVDKLLHFVKEIVAFCVKSLLARITLHFLPKRCYILGTWQNLG